MNPAVVVALGNSNPAGVAVALVAIVVVAITVKVVMVIKDKLEVY